MSYVPHTAAEREAMLARVGVESIEALYAAVPEEYRFPGLDLPRPLSEMEILAELRGLAARNVDAQSHPCFLGAGPYHHIVTSVVDFVISRSEFYTSYTPYQPEISQGTLQAIFEYQSMMCDLTGMDVSNASHYDGATAMAEAANMAYHIGRGRRRRVVVAQTVNPQYRETLRTYVQGMDLEIAEVGGVLADPLALADALDDTTACLIVQTPDFLGRVLDLSGVADAVHAKGALLVVVCNPISLGLLRPPGAYGADIALGEGQPLGNGLNYGGPYLGFFSCREEHVRRMAGRLVGQTVDAEGRRGYVLTLTTREQHIRREKATSNICTNQGLNALAAAAYMAAMGKCGLQQVASLCYHKAHYAAAEIALLDAYHVDLGTPFFHEFVVRCPKPVSMVNEDLFESFGIIGGYDLGAHYPEYSDHMLLAVTEMNTRQEIDALVEALEAIAL